MQMVDFCCPRDLTISNGRYSVSSSEAKISAAIRKREVQVLSSPERQETICGL
jgi:hypothetical protein